MSAIISALKSTVELLTPTPLKRKREASAEAEGDDEAGESVGTRLGFDEDDAEPKEAEPKRQSKRLKASKEQKAKGAAVARPLPPPERSSRPPRITSGCGGGWLTWSGALWPRVRALSSGK